MARPAMRATTISDCPRADRVRARTRQVVDYYDRIARVYADHYQAATPAGVALRIRRARVLELLGRTGPAVLDVGCGPGDMAAALGTPQRRFWGIDISAGMVAEAGRRHGRRPGVAFARARAEQLPFRDGAFDVVISTGALEYAADDVLSLREMARVLRSGGAMVVSLSHAWSPTVIWTRGLIYPLARAYRAWRHRRGDHAAGRAVHHVQRAYAEGWIKAHLPPGMVLEDLVYCNFKVLPPPLDRLLPPLDAALMRRLQRLGRGPLRWLGTNYVVRVRKV